MKWISTHGLIAAVCLLWTSTAFRSQTLRADVVTILTPKTEYVPGQAFDFSIQMPNISGLFAYEISLLLTSRSGTAGVDYFFLDDVAAPTNYVFPSSDNRAVTTVIDSDTVSRLTISDIDTTNFGTDVVADANDHVAALQFMTGADFQGILEISIDVGGLFLDDINLSPVKEYDSIVSQTSAAGPTSIGPTTTAVPEPAGFTFAFLGSLAMALARRRRPRVPRKACSR